MSGVGQRIVGHGGIYLLGNLLARTVSFIMLPIYTRNLTPADYGVIELLTMTLDLMGLLVNLRISQSIYRYYFKYSEDKDRNQVLFSSYVMTVATNVFAMACVLLLSEKLALVVFGNQEMSGMIGLFSLSLVFQGLVETPMVMLRAQQRPWIFLTASLFKLVMMLGLNIYFVVFRQMHVEGVIYSTLASGAIMSLILGVYLIKNTGFSFSAVKAKEMTRFSLPFAAVGALSFYINFGDRYFLRYFGYGLDEVGIYSLGYKFGFLLTFIVGDPFSNVWDSEKFRINNEHRDPTLIYRKVFLVYVMSIAVTFLALSLFGKNVIMLMSNREYWKATELIPVVCVAYACNCMAGFSNLGSLIEERTIEFTYGSIIAAVVVSAGYLILIPRYGAMGAAWATLLAFGARLVWITVRSKRYLDMKLEWNRALGIWVVIGAMWKISDFVQVDSLPVSFAINTVAVVACVWILMYLPILPESLRKEALSLFLHPRSSLRTLRSALGVK